jgi:hypothetical protein
MNLFGMKLKREYIVYHKMPTINCWFYSDPFDSKKSMNYHIDWLKKNNCQIKTKRRLTVEV